MRKFIIKQSSFFIYYIIYWSALACIGPYLGPYFEMRGLSGTQIGFIGSLSAIIVVISPLFIGSLADVFKKTKLMLLICIIGIIISLNLMRLSSFLLTIVLSSVLYNFFTSPTSGLADKLLLESIEGTTASYGYFRLGGSIGYCIGSLLIGYIIVIKDIHYVFYISSSILAISFFVVVALPGRSSVSLVKVSRKTSLHEYLLFVKSKRAWFTYGTLTIWGTTEAAIVSFLALHLLKHSYSVEHIGLCIAAAMVGEVFSFSLMPWALRSFSLGILIIFSFSAQLVRCITLFLLPPIPILLIGNLVGGASFALIWSVNTQIANNSFPTSVSNVAHNLKTIANDGFGRIISLPLCGLIYQYFGSKEIFLVMTFVSLVYILSFLLISSHYNQRKHYQGIFKLGKGRLD